jgi:hypothetical protein
VRRYVRLSASLEGHRGGVDDSSGSAFRFLHLNWVLAVSDQFPRSERTIPGLCEREIRGAAEPEISSPPMASASMNRPLSKYTVNCDRLVSFPSLNHFLCSLARLVWTSNCYSKTPMSYRSP